MTNLPLHARVALKDGADHVYVYALAGTEGWVRGQKTDDDGFDLVRIEWDKDHWRYNGQQDGWTYADHFYVIGPPSPPQHEQPQEDEEAVLPDPPASENEMDAYMQTLTDAMEAASESEGFLLVAVKRIPNPEKPSEILFAPAVFNHSVSREISMILDMQLAEMAANSYQEMVFNMMQSIKPDDDNDA